MELAIHLDIVLHCLYLNQICQELLNGSQLDKTMYIAVLIQYLEQSYNWATYLADKALPPGSSRLAGILRDGLLSHPAAQIPYSREQPPAALLCMEELE